MEKKNATRKENLEKLYDLCNELFKGYEECFYSGKDIEEMKKDSSNQFI